LSLQVREEHTLLTLQVFNEKAKTTLTCNQKRKECVAFIMNISPIHFDSYQIKIGVENGASLLSNGLVGEQVYFTVRKRNMTLTHP
jgi:hypothetical protein